MDYQGTRGKEDLRVYLDYLEKQAPWDDKDSRVLLATQESRAHLEGKETRGI